MSKPLPERIKRRIRKNIALAESLERQALELRASAQIMAERSCTHEHTEHVFRQDSCLVIDQCRWCGEHLMQGASGRIVVLDALAESL